MERVAQTPRADWRERLESQGFAFHSVDADGVPQDDGRFHYWREDVAYRFTEAEIEAAYEAAGELHAMAQDLVADLVARGDYGRLALPPEAPALIEASWARRDLSVYGRLDLAWDGSGPPKLLEYNADTPTSLVESSVAQWYWKEDVRPSADQFNSIHEALVERWKALREAHPGVARLHAAAMPDSPEDMGNAQYMLDTAIEAGFEGVLIGVPDLGSDPLGNFYDEDEHAIQAAYKLYPWEWALREDWAARLARDKVRWVEPPWKMLLSNKAMLPLLWERHRGHPNLLPAGFDRPPMGSGAYVKKPLLSREGANVTIVRPGALPVEVDGPYGAEGYVYQAYAPLPVFGGMHAVVGAWIVGDEPVGLCVREDDGPVTRNTSYFVPHYFE